MPASGQHHNHQAERKPGGGDAERELRADGGRDALPDELQHRRVEANEKVSQARRSAQHPNCRHTADDRPSAGVRVMHQRYMKMYTLVLCITLIVFCSDQLLMILCVCKYRTMNIYLLLICSDAALRNQGGIYCCVRSIILNHHVI